MEDLSVKLETEMNHSGQPEDSVVEEVKSVYSSFTSKGKMFLEKFSSFEKLSSFEKYVFSAGLAVIGIAIFNGISLLFQFLPLLVVLYMVSSSWLVVMAAILICYFFGLTFLFSLIPLLWILYSISRPYSDYLLSLVCKRTEKRDQGVSANLD